MNIQTLTKALNIDVRERPNDAADRIVTQRKWHLLHIIEQLLPESVCPYMTLFDNNNALTTQEALQVITDYNLSPNWQLDELYVETNDSHKNPVRWLTTIIKHHPDWLSNNRQLVSAESVILLPSDKKLTCLLYMDEATIQIDEKSHNHDQVFTALFGQLPSNALTTDEMAQFLMQKWLRNGPRLTKKWLQLPLSFEANTLLNTFMANIPKATDTPLDVSRYITGLSIFCTQKGFKPSPIFNKAQLAATLAFYRKFKYSEKYLLNSIGFLNDKVFSIDDPENPSWIAISTSIIVSLNAETASNTLLKLCQYHRKNAVRLLANAASMALLDKNTSQSEYREVEQAFVDFIKHDNKVSRSLNEHERSCITVCEIFIKKNMTPSLPLSVLKSYLGFIFASDKVNMSALRWLRMICNDNEHPLNHQCQHQINDFIARKNIDFSSVEEVTLLGCAKLLNEPSNIKPHEKELLPWLIAALNAEPSALAKALSNIDNENSFKILSRQFGHSPVEILPFISDPAKQAWLLEVM